MNKKSCVAYLPISTYSGYGSASRDKLKAIYENYKDEWDIKVLACRWGNTPWGFIDDHEEEWGWIKPLMIDQLTSKPNIWIMCTVPNEFQAVGDYNIGITAGIEVDVCDPTWIEGVNRMNLTIVPSEHSSNVFKNSKFTMHDKNTNAVMGNLELKSEVVVIPEGANLDLYKAIDKKDNTLDLNHIKEDFVFLFTGVWLQGGFGQDRKNVSLLIKAFCEVFKNKSKKPALLLKTTTGQPSYIDSREILRRINEIKSSCEGDLPNIYLLNGDLTDTRMNELYNHPKVKAMVSLTKGEGFGRPLLEFSLVNKPVIATNWSGHVDFLHKHHTVLIDGDLKPIDPSAIQKGLLNEGSKWFDPNPASVAQALQKVYTKYDEYKVPSRRQAEWARNNFSFGVMKTKLKETLDSRLPQFAQKVELKLPKLTKI